MKKAFICALILFFAIIKAHAVCLQPTDTITTSIFSNQPYNWETDGITYSESTSQEILGVDCILRVLNLTIYEPQTYSERIFNCGSYYWDKSDQLYAVSGVYTENSTDSEGKQIIYELVLTVDNSYAGSSGTGSCSEYQWHELETPIDWEANSVDMNGAGTIVALGNYSAEGKGQVKVYEWSVSGWTQKGSTLEGIEAGDNFGYDVSLSKNGKYLAVGAPFQTTGEGNSGVVYVYQWNGTDWETRGGSIESIHIYDELGRALDLNNDGSVLAIGAPACGRINLQLGEVRVYQWTGAEYEQFGESLYEDTGVSIPDNNGTSVALSGDGQTIIFGARFAKNTAFVNLLGGKYLIYDWNGTEWEKRESFSGYRSSMQLGFSVTISEDGQYFASGAMGDRGSAGMIFGNQGVLGEIFSAESGDQMGRSISMNAEGNVMAVGSSGNDDAAIAAGKVQVYRFDGDKWSQIGQDLLGTQELEFFGFQTQLNDAGNVLAVGTFGGSTSTVEDMHIYYYGCADAVSSCAENVVWESNTWSNIDGPSDGDVVHINDNFTLESDLSPGALTIADGYELTVHTGSTLDVMGDLTINGDLTVESGGSFISYENYVTDGVVTFKRNTRYANGRYSFVGSPVKDLGENYGSLLGPIVYRYDEYIPFEEDGLARWTDASDTRLIEGWGFAAAGQRQVIITGKPNTGEISTYKGYTEDATTTSDNWGWNIVSNPYCAAIDLDKFLAGNENIKGFIALWDDHGSNSGRGDNNDYLTVNGIGSVSGPNGGNFNGYIGTMQGFFVQMDGAGGRVYFTEDMRVPENNEDEAFFRKAENSIPKLKLAISTEDEKYSETLIGFPEDATAGFDRKYEATKLKSQSSFNIYSTLENQPLAIQGLPLEDEMIIPIGMDLNLEDKVRLSLVEFDGFDKEYEVYLIDSEKNTLEPLNINESINITDEFGEIRQNFELVIRKIEITTLEDVFLPFEFVAYSDGTNVQLSCAKCVSKADIRMINLSGKVVFQSQGVLFNQGKYSLKKPRKSGLYIIQLASTDGVGYVKLIIR